MFYFNSVNCSLYSKANGVSKKSEARKHHLNIICVSHSFFYVVKIHVTADAYWFSFNFEDKL